MSGWKWLLWLDYDKFDTDMEFEIPTLFRRNGRISKPQSIQLPFEDEPINDEFDQYALIDLIEFVAQNIRDITRKSYHSFFRHDDLSFGETNEIAGKFIEEINRTFQQTGLLYQLTTNLEVERIEETAILSEKIEKDIQAIKELGLHELLIMAVQKHKSPYPNDQKDAVEKIWDAFERLKTYYTNKSKRESADQIIGDMSAEMMSTSNSLHRIQILTEIGNNYRIRHHETNKIDITDVRHYDYFFNRCLALIGTAIQYLQ